MKIEPEITEPVITANHEYIPPGQESPEVIDPAVLIKEDDGDGVSIYSVT